MKPILHDGCKQTLGTLNDLLPGLGYDSPECERLLREHNQHTGALLREKLQMTSILHHSTGARIHWQEYLMIQFILLPRANEKALHCRRSKPLRGQIS